LKVAYSQRQRRALAYARATDTSDFLSSPTVREGWEVSTPLSIAPGLEGRTKESFADVPFLNLILALVVKEDIRRM
jgi:hypothetical protein